MVKKRVFSFFKKYGYYVVGGFMLIAIGVTLMFATSVPGGDNGIIDVSSQPITFTLPMNEVSVIKEYSDTELMYNQTLNQWEAHKAYTLTSEDLKVFAVAKGTVSEVGENYAMGNYVVITHQDGLKTFYASLDDNALVSVGDSVEKGQYIATASDTAGEQSEDGNHLYFEMYKDNEIVNPSAYLNFIGK